MAADIQYPVWTIHLPQPSGSKPLRCTTDPQGPGGTPSSYDDTGGSAARGGTIHTQFTNGIQTESTIVWGGYGYRIQSVTYGPSSVVYNHLGDIPGCSPESDSPNVPSPHGSIDIVATNTGKPATPDESQVNITVATPTIRISIPVYKRDDITKHLQGADSGYVPVFGSDLETKDTGAIQQLGSGKAAPPSVTTLLSKTDRYVYYRDPVSGCVFVPTKGLAIGSGVSPPKFTPSRGSDTHPAITRSAVAGDRSVLILPNNRGTARVMSASNQPFTPDKPGTIASTSPTNGIPVFVKDSQGKSVKIIQSSTSEENNAPHLPVQVMVTVKQVMVFVIICLSIFGIFVGLPMGSLHEGNSPYVSSILSVGVAFIFAIILSASSSVFGNSMVVSESSFPIISTVVFSELFIGALIVIALSIFPDKNTQSGDRISMIIYVLLFFISMMILTVGPYNTRTTKSTYSASYQMYPMFYDRILSMLKYTMPFAILLMFSSPIQNMFTTLFTTQYRGGTGLSPILNMVFNPDLLYSDVPSNPKPYRGSDRNLLESLVWFYDDSGSPKAPVDFAQYPVGYVQSSLTEISPPANNRNTNYTNVVAAVNHQGKTVAVNMKGRSPQFVEVTDGISPSLLLQKSSPMMKDGYGEGWRIGISVVLMVFFATVLMIPAFTGGIAFKTEQRVAEDKREEPTLSEVVLDSMYGFGVPLLTLASILYTFWGTNNNIQAGILSMGPVIALIVNGFAFANRK